MLVRAPHLRDALRGFCLGAFGVLARALEEGEELPFAFEEHVSPGRPALYEYRPLVRPFVERHVADLARRDDARVALAELRREPRATIFAHAHAHAHARAGDEDEALLASVLVPLLVQTAEGCGGLDWEDVAFDQAYAQLERALFGRAHRYTAIAPLIGLVGVAELELSSCIRVRPAVADELATAWPEARGLLPPAFGREPDRVSVLELVQDLAAGAEEVPDAPGELADAVTAIRLATAGPVAAGPVVFERLDDRPYAIRPVVPIAGAQPAGEPTRLDRFRGRLAADLLARLAATDDDPEVGEALDRWELSLFQAEPFRSEQLREALAALLAGHDGLWAGAMRAAVLLGSQEGEREELFASLRALAGGAEADAAAAEALRRALVEALLHDERTELLASLDDALLGVRPAPDGYYTRLATARTQSRHERVPLLRAVDD
ncbi:MAG: hypothetical protein ICV64_01995 [Thermoleophilia bacterium]|nr:hypothetical protein [Thermoleophilia bacterium]